LEEVDYQDITEEVDEAYRRGERVSEQGVGAIHLSHE
jgi:hypothetical protein